jgi:hypothetical protein
LDLIGGDQISELAFFPGMDVSSERKKQVFDIVMGMLSRHFSLVDMSTAARLLIDGGGVKTLKVPVKTA